MNLKLVIICLGILLLFVICSYCNIEERWQKICNTTNCNIDNNYCLVCSSRPGTNCQLQFNNIAGTDSYFTYIMNNTLYGVGNFYISSGDKIISSDSWKHITCGHDFSIAIKHDGTLWGWGKNDAGQVGVGNNTTINTLTQISSNKWKTVKCGGSYSMGIMWDGTLWGWGQNNQSQLGNGSFVNTNRPVQIGTGHIWNNIACSASNQTYAIDDDNFLWRWGQNISNTPVKVNNNTDWKFVYSHPYSFHFMILKNNGSLWGCGSNMYNCILNSSITNYINPVSVNLDTDWTYVACGDSYTMGIKTDGSLWGWGINNFGQIGNDTTQNILVPTKITTPTTSKNTSIECTYKYSLIIREDNLILYSGQLLSRNSNKVTIY